MPGLIAKADAAGQLLTLDAVTNHFRAITEICSTPPTMPACSRNSPAPSPLSGGSIVDAKAFTTTDGFAAGRLLGPGRRTARPSATTSGWAGCARPSKRPCAASCGPAASWPARPLRTKASAFTIRPKIHFDNEASRIATVIEVECLDRPGLLYDITQAIFEAGLSISTSMVATYGERAVDVFYVRDGFGHKIVHPARLQAVEKRAESGPGARAS